MSKSITLEQFSKMLEDSSPLLKDNIEKTIKLCCEKVRSDIQYSMAHTQKDLTKSYFTHNKKTAHHPSLPGHPPAVDTGNLRNSIRYEVHNEDREVYGIVGTTQKDPPYGAYLEQAEYGSSKMRPRPWLKPAMEKNMIFIKKSFLTIFQGIFGR